jgi:hypothetical protein
MESSSKPNQFKTYSLIFLTSLLYAPLLHWWQRVDPVGRYNNVWLATVIGCGYILLYIRKHLKLKDWLTVCTAFFYGSIPIVAQALIHQAIHNRKHNNFNSAGRKGRG